MRSLLALAVVASLVPGCTAVGGLTGLTAGAIIHNGEPPHTYKTTRGVTVTESPVVKDTLIGMGVGLLLDVAAVAAFSYSLRNVETCNPCHFD